MASYDESFTMNGTDTSVSVQYGVAFTPTVTLDAVSQAVYQTGVDAWGQDGWYWTLGSTSLVQGIAAAPVAASVIEVVYESQLSNYAKSIEAADQLARSSAYRSGKIEIAIAARGTATVDEAQQIASAALRRVGTLVQQPSFMTQWANFRIGESLSIVDTRYDLNGQFLISEISMSIPSGGPVDIGHGTCFERDIDLIEIATMEPQTPAEPDSGAVAGGPSTWESSFTALTGGGAGASLTPAVIQQERAAFLLGIDSDFVGGIATSNTYPVINASSGVRVVVTCTTPPIGQSLEIDITRNGVSIFTTALGRPTITPADTIITWIKFKGYNVNPMLHVPYRFAVDDVLQATGSYITADTTVTPAQGLTIMLVMAY